MKGHTKTGTLKFMRETIWGPDHCHEKPHPNWQRLCKTLIIALPCSSNPGITQSKGTCAT